MGKYEEDGMNVSFPPQEVAAGLWVLSYPMKMLGIDFHRNVTIIRLSSGRLVIHSTAPFTPDDVSTIKSLGEPGWLVDALLRHDTFAQEGRTAFPEIPYLAPAGFSEKVNFPVGSLLPPPAEWQGELEVLRVEGVPFQGEHVFFHPATRTLIVADLLFNLHPKENLWSKIMLKLAMAEGKPGPDLSKPFLASIEDRSAFAESISQILAWDFDQIIVGHGDVIPDNGRDHLRRAILASGWL